MKTIIIINIIATLVTLGIAVTALAKVTRTERTVTEHSVRIENIEKNFVQGVYNALLEIQKSAQQ